MKKILSVLLVFCVFAFTSVQAAPTNYDPTDVITGSMAFDYGDPVDEAVCMASCDKINLGQTANTTQSDRHRLSDVFSMDCNSVSVTAYRSAGLESQDPIPIS